MTAHARTRPTRRPEAGGVDARLPWWAVVLPAIAFAVLLALTAGGEAGAAESSQHLGRLLEYVLRLLSS
ncbi:MAG TPA: hypothetical protein VE546_03615 [Streptomyces sp.]|uniref:hypothetical protein n=1 Tax=Streptomyces sp. TaxID=1931 RepID=UPI002D383CF9|nr:hypothetical protein [Streptomyces sp.]HZG02662.1 hypothetical protein [Streptomyces sp.]